MHEKAFDGAKGRQGAGTRPLRDLVLAMLGALVATGFAIWGLPFATAKGERVELSQVVQVERPPTDYELTQLNEKLGSGSPAVECRPESNYQLVCAARFAPESANYAAELGAFKAAVDSSLDVAELRRVEAIGGLSSRSVFLGTGMEMPVVSRSALILFSLALILLCRALMSRKDLLVPQSAQNTTFALIAVLAPVLLASASLVIGYRADDVGLVLGATFIAAVVLTAVGEELFFRRWMIGELGSRLGIPISISLSSLLFAFSHDYANALTYVVALVVGACLGFYFYVRRSLLVCIVVHASYNLLVAAQ